MFLAKVEIEDLRSIEMLKMDFTGSNDQQRKWTLLPGENGSGKRLRGPRMPKPATQAKLKTLAGSLAPDPAEISRFRLARGFH